MMLCSNSSDGLDAWRPQSKRNQGHAAQSVSQMSTSLEEKPEHLLIRAELLLWVQQR
jgi:hypothetical protein